MNPQAQFNLEWLRNFNALPMRERNQFLKLCDKIESNGNRNPQPAPEEERVGSESDGSGEALQRIRQHQTRGRRKARGEGERVPGRWLSKLITGGKTLRLGIYDSREDAHNAYRAKHLELFGEWSMYFEHPPY